MSREFGPGFKYKYTFMKNVYKKHQHKHCAVSNYIAPCKKKTLKFETLFSKAFLVCSLSSLEKHTRSPSRHFSDTTCSTNSTGGCSNPLRADVRHFVHWGWNDLYTVYCPPLQRPSLMGTVDEKGTSIYRTRTGWCLRESRAVCGWRSVTEAVESTGSAFVFVVLSGWNTKAFVSLMDPSWAASSVWLALYES